MRSRQRGAVWLLALLTAGRLLDRLDLPFENRARPSGAASGLPAADSARASGVGRASAFVSAPPPAPGRAATDSTPSLASRSASDSAPVAINRASGAELQRLPGVGPVLAGRILAHRDAHGPFRNLADLRGVRGIGPQRCERLAPHVRFD
jgi:competence protein ComEA